MKKLTKNTATVFMTLGLGLGISSLGIQSASAQAEAAAEKKAVAKISVGDAIPADVFEGVTWVQGEEVKTLNEKGKTYILECWATWCGPCITVIPHVNEMHKKFESKGLVIIGMNVFEDGIEKSQEFVKKQGDGMSYRVAYSGGRTAPFTDKILKPAGVTGIPRALVVQDGKLVLSIHPSQLNDELVTSLLDRSFDSAAFAKKQADEDAARKALIAKLQPLQQAKDWDGIKKVAEGLEDKDAMKFGLLAMAATNSSNWQELITLRKNIETGKYADRIKPAMLDSSVVRDCAITDEAKAYSDIALAQYEQIDPAAKPSSAVQHHITKARLLYMSKQVDQTKAELAAADALLEKIDNPRAQAYFSGIVKAAIEKVNAGSFPDFRKLMQK